MRLYNSQVKVLSHDLVRELIKQEAIEVEKEKEIEVQLDLESVLSEYIRTERELNEEVRDVIERRRLDYGSFGRIKRQLAKQKNFGLGEDAYEWVVKQLIEVLLHTVHVEEVWAEDHDLRRLISPVLRKHTATVGEELDKEVRNRIKNLSEDSTDWDVRYDQVMNEIKRRKGLE